MGNFLNNGRARGERCALPFFPPPQAHGHPYGQHSTKEASAEERACRQSADGSKPGMLHLLLLHRDQLVPKVLLQQVHYQALLNLLLHQLTLCHCLEKKKQQQ